MLDRMGGFLSFPLVTFGPLFRELFSAKRDGRRLIGDAMRESLIVGIVDSAINDGSLKAIGSAGSGPGLSRALGRFFANLARHSVTDPAQVAAAAGEAHPAKLDEALLLYERYRAVLEKNNLIDDELAGLAVCQALANREAALTDYLGRIELLMVDGFFTFSPLEERLLLALIQALPETWINLPNSSEGAEEVFALPRRVLGLLESLSERVQVSIEPSDVEGGTSEARESLANRIYTDEVLQIAVEGPAKWDESLEVKDIRIVEALNSREELKGVARSIKMLVLDGLTQPSRIVIAAPNAPNWERDLRQVLSEYGIPVADSNAFFSSQAAGVGAFLKVLTMVRDGFRRQDVLNFLKSPFLGHEGLLRGDGSSPPPKIDVAYIDRITREAKISGGGGPSLAEYEQGFSRLRSVLKTRAERHPNDEKLPQEQQILDRQTTGLLSVLDVLLSRFGKDQAPETFAANCLKTLSELEVADRLAEAHSSSRGRAGGMREELRALNHLVSALSEVSAGLSIGGLSEITPGLFFAALSSALVRKRIRTSTGSDGVRLLPIREAWLADCDYIFCCGLTEDAFPGRVPFDVFITPELRARLGLRSPEELAGEAKFLIHALLVTPVKGVTLSYPASVDGKPTLAASCLEEIEIAGNIKPLRWEGPVGPGVRPCSIQELDMAIGSWARRPGPTVSDEAIREAFVVSAIAADPSRAERPSPRGLVRRIRSARAIGERGPDASDRLSPKFRRHLASYLTDDALVKQEGCPVFLLSSSSLEDYISCPFKFFAKRVLRIEPPDEFDPDLSHQDVGILVHEAFCRFYRERRTSDGSIEGVTDENLADATKQLRQVTVELMDRSGAPPAVKDSLASLLLSPNGLLASFLRLEATQSKQWRARWLEAAFGAEQRKEGPGDRLSAAPLMLECEVEGERALVAVTGFIDRVDESVEGGGRLLRVIDYKTGQTPQAAQIRDGSSVQMPVYVRAVSDLLNREAVSVYYGVSLWDVVSITDYPQANPIPDAAAHLDEAVCEILSQLLGCDFTPSPIEDDARVCEHCDYRDICRRARTGV